MFTFTKIKTERFHVKKTFNEVIFFKTRLEPAQKNY